MRRIRLWQRDFDIVASLARSPMTTSQIAQLHGVPLKKCRERLCDLERAGFVKRMPYVLFAKQGKPENLYYLGKPPKDSTVQHLVGIGWLHVASVMFLREAKAYKGEFYFTHERQSFAGIIPDATLALHKDDKRALILFELDTGAEAVRSVLAQKICRYAQGFDTLAYLREWPGIRGFRVCLLVPAGRISTVQQLITQEQHDFVLLATLDALREKGLHAPIWLTHDGNRVNILGRPGELIGDDIGEKLGTQNPSNERESR